MTTSRAISLIFGVALLLLTSPGSARSAADQGYGAPGTVEPYIDPKQQTTLEWLKRSHYLQPWRGYQETPPAETLRNAVGINLNVPPEQADAVCAQLARAGFRHARIEIGWGSLTEDDPPRLGDPGQFAQILGACRRHHLRPLLLLNANEGAPCPRHNSNVRLLRPAEKGSRVIFVDPRETAVLVPGRSGLDNQPGYCAAEILFTAIDADGTVHLSRPLPKDLPAGEAAVTTLKYAPFYPAPAKGEKASPEYARTMAGWLSYVRVVAAAAKANLDTAGKADSGFDFEIWNELSFGSRFLWINYYYDTPLVQGEPAVNAVRAETASFVRDPGNGLPGVGVCDGFDSESPWGAGSNEPPGITALAKHPYRGTMLFDSHSATQPFACVPVDALGNRYGVFSPPGSTIDGWNPDYNAFLPEYFLTGIQTEYVIRDLSPITTGIGPTQHGRLTHPILPDGSPVPPPALWITEVGMAPYMIDAPAKARYQKAGGITPEWASHFRAKAVLRYLAAWVGRGTERIYFYAAHDQSPDGMGLVSPAFFDAVKAQGNNALSAADETALMSPELQAVRRLVEAATPRPGEKLTVRRSISLMSVSDRHGHYQFAGDPATVNQKPNPRPPLYDRDCVGFFPFQVADGRFVAAVYVMTRDMGTFYHPDAPPSDVTRSDLPDEKFKLKLKGINSGVRFSLINPLTGATLKDAVRVVAVTPDGTITLELPLTDYPRLLTISDGGR